jgi:TniQ
MTPKPVTSPVTSLYGSPADPPNCSRILHPDVRPDETFGSWFEATAALHGCTRSALAQALLAERGLHLPHGRIDWDLQPPQGLLEALERRLQPRLVRQLRESVPKAHRDWLPADDRGTFCADCLRVEGGPRQHWEHCQNVWAWTVVCESHQCPLRALSPLGLRLLGATRVGARGQNPSPAAVEGPSGNGSEPRRVSFTGSRESIRWFLEVQQLFRRPERGHPMMQYRLRGQVELDESVTRLIVRDLVMATWRSAVQAMKPSSKSCCRCGRSAAMALFSRNSSRTGPGPTVRSGSGHSEVVGTRRIARFGQCIPTPIAHRMTCDMHSGSPRGDPCALSTPQYGAVRAARTLAPFTPC